MVGEALLPCLPWWHVTDLYHSEFWTTCACPEKQSWPKIFHCVEIFFTIHRVFEQRCACLKNRECPENFHCIEYTFHIQDFWATCACPEKQRVLWNHGIEYIFFIIQNFEQLALALKNRVCLEIFQIHCIEIFYIFQDFWATCACPERQKVPWIHCIEYIFLCFSILNNLRLPWKTEFALKCFTVLKYFISFRIFQQLALSLKTESALKIFTVWNILFTFSIFEQLALALKNSVPWKTEFALKIFTVLKYFIIHDFLAICACVEFALHLQH